ncbi:MULTISPECIES: hypothetical protein [unclassified Duganella]|uniref:hypothetical protein n=1 Tax=unclassified Duganella TaxID=2636909 RepID=UPI000E356088|nr:MULTISPECIES: hypothetical protein [unclassified Duganella]RFP10696.1 hypothetical protein D0T23_22085 [Duganella sp. BJB475]RFP27277.1 hypothetical protein D0T21_25155 [Duganella sp. BJB476]
MRQATRFPWNHFPPVYIHASENFVKTHHAYPAATAGDTWAAMELVADAISFQVLEQLWKRFDAQAPVLVSVRTTEASGVNVMPDAMARTISALLRWPWERRIVQANKLKRAGASGYERLQRQVIFSGRVLIGLNYLLVDDFLSELRRQHGHIEYWWRQRFGFGFESLTASEARFLSRARTAERIIEGLEAVDG